MEENILSICKGRPIRLLLGLIFSLFLLETIKAQDLSETEIGTGQITENDRELIRELETFSSASWKNKKEILSKLSFLTKEEEDKIAGSKNFEALSKELKGPPSLLANVLEMSILPTSANKSFHARQVVSSGNQNKFNFRLIYSKENITLTYFQLAKEMENSYMVSKYAGIAFLRKNHQYIVGNLRLKAGLGLLFGPARSPDKGFNTIRPQRNLKFGIKHAYPGFEAGVMQGIGVFNKDGTTPWAFFIGDDQINEKRKIAMLGIGKNSPSYGFGTMAVLSESSQFQKIPKSLFWWAGSKNRSVMGEVAADKFNKTAITLGVVANEGNYRTGVYYRKFEPGYTGVSPNPVAQWSSKERNETGFLMGIEKRGKQINLKLYRDQYWKTEMGLAGSGGHEKGAVIRYALRKIAFKHQIIISEDKIYSDPMFLSNSNSYENIQQSIKTDISVPITAYGWLKVNTCKKVRIKDNKKSRINSVVLRAIVNVKPLKVMAAFGKTITSVPGPSVYLYGFNLYEEAPLIVMNRPGIVMGVQLRYQNRSGGRIAIKTLKIIKKKEQERESTWQVTVMFSTNN